MPAEEEPPGSSQMRLVAPGARRELEQRFEIRAVLGRGAMGTVLRALDRQLEREVALKLPLRGGGERRLARFAREGEITASLQHPGIVAVHSAGVVQDQPWIAYELVTGARTLGQVLPELPVRRRVELVRDAAAALGHAHAQGIVHRDVKPDNLLVDAQERLKVADFGLAAAEGQERLTQTGAMIGTPHYMAPEQIGGRAQVGPPADVWALGVILYQALTDQLPFAGETFLALAQAIARQDPVSPGKLAPGTPRELEAVCLRALSRAPADRYADAAGLAADLDAWLSGTPISGSGWGSRTRARMRARASRLLLALPVVLAAVLLGWSLRAARVEPTGGAGGAGPSSTATAPPPESPRLAEARRRWGEISKLELAERLRAAQGWLHDYGELPLAAEVRAALAGRPVPKFLATVRHTAQGKVGATWFDARTLLTWGRDGYVGCWSLEGQGPREPRQLQRWLVSLAPILALACSGGHFWAGDQNGSLAAALQVDPRSDTLPGLEHGEHGAAIVRVGVSSAGFLAVGGPDWVELMYPDRIVKHDLIDPVRGLVFLNGKRLVVASGDSLGGMHLAENALRLIDLQDGRELQVERLGFQPSVAVGAPDGERFAVATASGHVFIYDAALQRVGALAGRDVGTLQRGGIVVSDVPLALPDTVTGMAWFPDGRHLVAVSHTNLDAPPPQCELRIWDMTTGEEIWRDLHLPRPPWTLELSPDGRLLALGSREGVIDVYELGE